MSDDNVTPFPPPKRRRGRPPGPPKPPKPRKRKPNSETIVGKARLAALMSDEEDQIVSKTRPIEYRKEFPAIAKKMCQLGATDADLADAFDVNITTIWRWQGRFPKFAKALEVGKDPADERVVRSLYQRAVGYSYDSVRIHQYEGKPVVTPFVEHVPPDPGAAKTWLVNRRCEEWKDSRTLEHTGANGRSLAEELGTDQKALMETARWIADRFAAASSLPAPIDITPTKLKPTDVDTA